MRALTLPGTIWKNRNNKTTAPRFLTYIVTFTCNAKCIMCDSWKKPSPNDLKLEEIERIFGELPRMDGVRLSGGEPFVRKDLLDIAHMAQDKLRPMFLHITTNGFLTDRIVELCEKRKKDMPLMLLVSVDGLEEKHNYVRGKDTAWSSVVNTLESLAPRQKELKLKLAINQTIVDPEGVEHYKKLRGFTRNLGVTHNMVMAYDVSATYNLEEEVDVAPTQIGEFCTFGDFTRDTIEDLLNEVEKDSADLPFADRIAKQYYLRGIRSRLLGENSHVNPPCVALNTHMRLLPNGDVPTCQFNTKKAGNLREMSFDQLWYGGVERMEKQRDWVRKCPGCWAECEVIPNALYTGDLLKETIMPSRKLAGAQKPEAVEAG